MPVSETEGDYLEGPGWPVTRARQRLRPWGLLSRSVDLGLVFLLGDTFDRTPIGVRSCWICLVHSHSGRRLGTPPPEITTGLGVGFLHLYVGVCVMPSPSREL